MQAFTDNRTNLISESIIQTEPKTEYTYLL